MLQVSLVLAVLCAAARASPALTQLPSPTTPQGAQGAQAAQGRCGGGWYWSAAQRRCLECSHCAGPGREVTLRPCEGHRDALCGSVSDLHIDWSWLREHYEGRNGKKKAPGECLTLT